ncbi:PadR family transcriptional regulator [Paenibacillus aceris]|uniref:DNA-binding PadR family transcriptional regulator n=1 Tax=Paenibacillus aceris TaxID=869555 RepID=A0ABS4HZ46_9BACL|nr:PadR family transcriptional regulator [Paenibacillus aceris]MBP1963946.1 DNA-binding PadR family transcriptional regulator [Paenibacillus aceris]NHW34635.1 PadR family transcriptional regulator [Paenibacillus aceris]
MNTLSYGLLSLLSKDSRTGYELMHHIQPFWPAKHSQIYPLLAQLEQKGYVEFVHVPQSDKPDKKVYSLTANGLKALQEWIGQPTDAPVTRDEFALKVYCIGLVDKDEAKKMLLERENYYLEKKVSYLESFERVKCLSEKPLEELGMQDPMFGNYVLIRKAVLKVEADLTWCKWMKSKLK